ncbi:MAG: flgD [Firmicutes bacterium]|nr:flgD [Bacillota bacterium]
MADGTSLNTINGVVASTVASTTSTSSNDALGKEEFLQLLTTQMQYQDPLDPQDNSEYVAQLAQFSALEQMTNLNTTATTLSDTTSTISTSLLVAQASNFIGKEVTWTDSNNTVQNGQVTSVKITDGKPYVVVDNNDVVDISAITLVGTVSSTSTTTV